MKRIFLILLLGLVSLSAAENLSFSGQWETNWGPLEMVQDGRSVTGTYAGQYPGSLKGTVEGNRLDFEWKGDNGDSGFGYFELSEDGNAISGEWGSEDSNNDGGEWNGKRVK